MKPSHQYWSFSAIRGAMTMIASFAIVAIPQATSSILSLPVLIALAVDCLATYSVFDGVVMILLEKLLPARAAHRSILYGQMVIALTSGGLLYLVVYGLIGMGWVLWIAATQAALAAVAEFFVARDTHKQYGCLSCYITSIILALSAMCLPFASGQSPTVISAILATYVGLYGASQLTLGARMLFLEYRSVHPAAVASELWRSEMFQPPAAKMSPLVDRLEVHPISCSTCPADAFCHDNSPAGKLAKVLAERRPAIVISMRAAALLSEATETVAA